MSSSSIYKSSSPVLKSNSPAANSLPPPPSTSTSFNEDHPISTNKPSHFKRPFQYTLYPDQLEFEDDGNYDSFPVKRSKTLLTTFTCRRTHESAVYFTQRMLELSRVSRRALAAQMEYQRLRAEELRLIRSIMEDEAEESKAYLNRTDMQIGSLRNDLFDAGVAVIGRNGRESHDAKEVRCGKMFPHFHENEADDSSECDGSVYDESEYHESN